MYAYSELGIVRPPTVKRLGGEHYVMCHAIRGEYRWLDSSNYYLHQNGSWSMSTLSDEGRTAYFDSEQSARACLNAVIFNRPISHRDDNVLMLNVSAQAHAARERKRHFNIKKRVPK